MPILSSTINITFAIQGDPSGSWVRSKCSQNAQSFQSLMTSDPRCLRHSGMGFRINLYREPGWDSWSYMSSLSNTWTIRNANTNKISFKQDESTNLFIGMQRCTPILSHRAYEYLWITTTRMLPQFHIPLVPQVAADGIEDTLFTLQPHNGRLAFCFFTMLQPLWSVHTVH